MFRKGGRVRKQVLRFENSIIEQVKEYTYLGITFSSSALFMQEVKQAVKKSNIAIGNVRNILVNSRAKSWDARVTLFNSIVTNTLLYGAETWGLRYMSEIELVQTNFFKQIFNWPRNTPGYMIRVETGMDKLGIRVLKRAILWWIKLLEMNEQRYPRICFMRMRELDKSNNNSIKFNWASQLKHLISHLGFSRLWDEQKSHNIRKELNNILKKYGKEMLLMDWERVVNSTYNDRYQALKKFEKTEKYLTLPINIDKLRVISQLRLMGNNYIRFIIRGYRYSWDPNSICMVCNLRVAENLFHVLSSCPIYHHIRTTWIAKYISHDLNANNFHEHLLSNLTVEKICDIYLFVVNMVKIRSFMLFE